MPDILGTVTTQMLIWPMLRVLCAVLILVAVWQQAATTVAAAHANGWPLPTVIANFFSFFTILSNVVAMLVLFVAGLRSLGVFGASGRRLPEPRWLAFALACATSYMVLTGIVYNVLLRQISLDQGTTVPWSNEVLHVVAPVFMALDLFFAPGRLGLRWSSVFGVLVFPMVWIGYTLVRGPLITAPTTGNPWWYPYPFLDPHLQGGYLGVVAYIVAIAVAIALLAWGVVAVGRWRGRRAEALSSVVSGLYA